MSARGYGVTSVRRGSTEGNPVLDRHAGTLLLIPRLEHVFNVFPHCLEECVFLLEKVYKLFNFICSDFILFHCYTTVATRKSTQLAIIPRKPLLAKVPTKRRRGDL